MYVSMSLQITTLLNCQLRVIGAVFRRIVSNFFISVVAARSGFLGHNCYTKIGIFTYPIRGKCAFFQHTNVYTRTLYVHSYELIIRKNS